MVAFGDQVGLPRLLRFLPPAVVAAIVRAEARPEQATVLKRFADKHRLPLLVQPRADSRHYAEWVATLRALVPDLILVDSYSMLLRSDVLAIPRFGAINIHGGLLPAFRGANPTQWALIADKRRTGVTMHYMTEAFDAGDVIAQRQVPIRFEDTWLDVHARIDRATEQLLVAELPAVLQGRAWRQPQDEREARHHRRRTPEDGRIDWSKSVLSIYNLIRALVQPHPGAFYERAGGRVILDNPHTVAEVAALKYGRAGRCAFEGATVRLEPVVDRQRPDEVALRVLGRPDRTAMGMAAFRAIDWTRRTGAISLSPGIAGSALTETLELALRFGRDQLGLLAIDVRHGTSDTTPIA